MQNNSGLISFSVEEAEEEKVEEEKVEKEVKAKERTSGNILVVETDFERMPRRSCFRSKERRELTRYLKEGIKNTNQSLFFNSIFFPRGASIQFDEKPANVIVNTNSTTVDANESDDKEEEDDEREVANSEE